MEKGYCMKCKAEREMKDVVHKKMKNGRPAASGTCAKCGTKMFKILSTKQGKGEDPLAEYDGGCGCGVTGGASKRKSRKSRGSRKSKSSRKSRKSSKKSRGSRKSRSSRK